MEGFKLEDVITAFRTELGKLRPELTELLSEDCADMEYLKEVYRPHAMDFLKKNEELFTVPRVFLRGIDFSAFWGELNSRGKDTVWDLLRTGLVASYIGDDWMKTIRDLWVTHTGKSGDEIDEVLNDSTTKTSLEELFEYFKETRIFKLGMEMMETLKLEQFGVDELDFTNPAALFETLKDPNNPLMQRATSVVGGFVEDKIRKGSLRKEDLIQEMELLREKFKHSLGRIFQENLFGEAPRETQRADVLLSSSPDARRARMLARLQRKVRDRSGK